MRSDKKQTGSIYCGTEWQVKNRCCVWKLSKRIPIYIESECVKKNFKKEELFLHRTKDWCIKLMIKAIVNKHFFRSLCCCGVLYFLIIQRGNCLSYIKHILIFFTFFNSVVMLKKTFPRNLCHITWWSRGSAVGLQWCRSVHQQIKTLQHFKIS